MYGRAKTLGLFVVEVTEIRCNHWKQVASAAASKSLPELLAWHVASFLSLYLFLFKKEGCAVLLLGLLPSA